MKLYVIIKTFYNYADTWDVPLHYYISEEKAYEKLIELEEELRKTNPNFETEWLNVEEVNTED